MNRRKMLTVYVEFLAEFFSQGMQKHYEVIKDGLPPDARIVDARFDGFSRRVDFLLESPSFDEVPEGEAYPSITPTMRTIDGETPPETPATD